MLKKIILISIIVQLSSEMNAQFFRGFGFFIGATSSSHRYRNLADLDPYFFAHTLPAPSHRSAEFLHYSGGIFAELLKFRRVRWQTEFEYCKKGAKERSLIFPWPIQRGDATKNKYTNIEWNNYLKFFINEGYFGNYYLLLGARLDYNISRSLSAYTAVANIIPKINVSANAGLGFELATYGKWHPFVEFHYNPDILKRKLDNVTLLGRMFELRIGLIFRPRKKSIDDCNAPKYRGSKN